MTNGAGGFTLRAATPGDSARMVQLSTGPIAGKAAFIEESFNRRTIFGAYVDDRIAGYIIWDRNFFGRPFVWLLGVERPFRRRGIASALLEKFEHCCTGETLFTSTNESNAAMQLLLERRGFAPSGRVENLDPGDPELFYCKTANVKKGRR